MGNLTALGAALLIGLTGSPAVTAREAVRAIHQDFRFAGAQTIVCRPRGAAEVCRVSSSATYTDAVVGPAEVVGTTVARVSRSHGGYRVRIIVPDRTDIWAQ